MPPQPRPTSISLSYSMLLSLLSALFTLKLYHTISFLTHGRTPSLTTIQAIEQRIAAYFLRIVPEKLAYPSTAVVGVDGANTNTDVVPFPYAFQYRVPPPSVYPRAYTGSGTSTQTRTRTRTRMGASTNSNTNSNSYGHPSINPHAATASASRFTPIFHFSAFDLPSNQTQSQSRTRTPDESSFVQSLATCAPYQRVGLRLVPGGHGCVRGHDRDRGYTLSSSAGLSSALSSGLPDMDQDEVFPASASISEECTPASASASACVSVSTPKISQVANIDQDLEACLSDPVAARLANSFPGESPVTFGAVRDDSGTGIDIGMGGSPAGRGKAVYSVRPFSNLD